MNVKLKSFFMKKRVLFTLACLFLWTGMAMAQVSRITGVVVSAEDNEPIVGASVLVKGTTLGTITDMNGRYSINNIPVNAKSLVISFVGMKTQELAIKGGCTVSIVKDEAVDTFIETIGKAYAEKVGHEAEFYTVDIGDGASRLA